MQKYNNWILILALKGRGYNNSSVNLTKSGELKAILRLTNLQPKVIFDVGANIGTYSRIFLDKTSAEVYAFEPLPESYKSLVLLNKYYEERFFAFNYALGDVEITMPLLYNKGTDGLASLSSEINVIPYVGKNNINSVNVNVRTLDEVFLEFKGLNRFESIDILKIDVEGFEMEVINGAKSMLKEFPPKAIILEFNWHQLLKSQSIYNFQKKFQNYRIYQVLPFGQGIFEIDPISPESNIYCYSNFIFVREDCVASFMKNTNEII